MAVPAALRGRSRHHVTRRAPQEPGTPSLIVAGVWFERESATVFTLAVGNLRTLFAPSDAEGEAAGLPDFLTRLDAARQSIAKASTAGSTGEWSPSEGAGFCPASLPARSSVVMVALVSVHGPAISVSTLTVSTLTVGTPIAKEVRAVRAINCQRRTAMCFVQMWHGHRMAFALNRFGN